MPLNLNALATFADAQTLFGYAADEQDRVEAIINIASARIEGYCGRRLAARDYSGILLDGTGDDELVLPEYPINSVASISVDDSRAFAVALASNEYGICTEAGILIRYQGSWGTKGRRQVIKASFNSGYATTHEQFPVLKAACLEYVDWLKSRWGTPGASGKKGEYSADGVSVSYETDMPMHVKALLEEFRR